MASTPPDDAPDFVVVDVETACSRVSSICQIGIVGFRGGREVFAYETLVDPRDEFHLFNTRIHGIAADHVVGQPHFGDIHSIIDGHLAGRTTVAHSYFDKGALAAACRVHDRSVIDTTWLDSVRVAKRAWPELASHRLNVLTQHLGIAHRHHDALSDARAAGMVVVKAIEHTGIPLAGWLLPTPKQRVRPAPKPAATGPLKGERIAILGEPRDGRLAQALAALGGRVVSSVGLTTTMLAIAGTEPYPVDIRYNAQFLKAHGLQRGGHAIRILPEAAVLGG
ncbi:exonuclease domain-containing protein [Sphingomonas sp. PB2P19]|uniref:exonuclease domain-containing protein n=1 Tax=Sphingomonas rhamnosi TaxID=3096156 RepID=UPI002FCA0090